MSSTRRPLEKNYARWDASTRHASLTGWTSTSTVAPTGQDNGVTALATIVFYAYCETRWSPSRSSVSAIAAKPINNPFVELIRTNPDRSSKRSGFFMPADVPRAAPPAARGRLPSSGLHAPGTSSRTQEGFAVPRRPRLAGGKRTLRYRFGTIPTAERAPPCLVCGGAGKRSGAWTRRDPFIFFWAVCLRQGS